MPTKLSAYLQIYNDWDFLAPMLRSIAPYVDELVVVDGAYAWMADFLERSGRNPLRSDARVFDALEDSRIPYRVITKLWKNEIEKRMAGYTACEGRYVLRIDADEVMFFDDAELERFFSDGSAIAQVELPSYIAPGWLKAIKSPEGDNAIAACPNTVRQQPHHARHPSELSMAGAGFRTAPQHRREAGSRAFKSRRLQRSFDRLAAISSGDTAGGILSSTARAQKRRHVAQRTQRQISRQFVGPF